MTAPQYPPPDPYAYGPQPTEQFPAQPGPYGGPYGAGPTGPFGPPARREVNPAGLVVVLIGGAVALLGAFLDWYTDIQLSDIVNALDVEGAKAFPKAYFSWLMWVVLAATGVAGLFANLPGGASAALRVLSPILGVLGAVLVFGALSALIENGSPFDHSSAGLYLTMAGFIVTGIGGALGPRDKVGP